jgi:hypothetical protein
MFEIVGEDAQTQVMDHYGIMAAVCKGLKLAERITKRLKVDHQRRVSSG